MMMHVMSCDVLGTGRSWASSLSEAMWRGAEIVWKHRIWWPPTWWLKKQMNSLSSLTRLKCSEWTLSQSRRLEKCAWRNIEWISQWCLGTCQCISLCVVNLYALFKNAKGSLPTACKRRPNKERMTTPSSWIADLTLPFTSYISKASKVSVDDVDSW